MFEKVLSQSKWNFQMKNAETIRLELTIVKKKWCILFAYRPPNTDKEEFFDEISVSLNKILGKFDILAGDLKLVSAIFYQICIFSPNYSLLKTVKNFFYFI